MELSRFTVGDGREAVALLHGYLGSGRNLRTLATRWSELDRGLRFVVPDLTGHGESPPLGEDATLETVARDVQDTLDAEGVTGKVRWVGHSFGGRVSLAAARRFADRMKSVDLLDISPGPADAAQSETRKVIDVLLAAPAQAPGRGEIRAYLAQHLSQGLADWLAMNLVPAHGGGVTWRIDREALSRAHAKVLAEDLWDVIDAHPVPIRCAWGERSRYVPVEDLDRMRAAGVPIQPLPAGHFVHVEALEELISWLRAG